MPETWRVWRLVRFFNKKQFGLAIDDPSASKILPENKDEIARKLIDGAIRKSQPCVSRLTFAGRYVKHLFDEHAPTDHLNLKDANVREKILKVQSLIESALDTENGYLKKNEKDDDQIYITKKGKKFASIDGLLIAWKDDLTPFASIFLALVAGSAGTAGAINQHSIIAFIENLKWW